MSDKFQIQTEITFRSFAQRPKTMLQVSIETGILRANICRYVASFEKVDKIARIRKGICPISKHPAVFYSTDPEQIEK